MANPKGKKNISLTIPIELGLEGKDLKKGLSQLFSLYHSISKIPEPEIKSKLQELTKDFDIELLKKLETAIK